MDMHWKYLYVFWAAASVFQIAWGLWWGLAPHRYLFFTVVIGALFVVARTAEFRRLWTLVPGAWWVKAGVMVAGVLGLYEWVRTW